MPTVLPNLIKLLPQRFSKTVKFSELKFNQETPAISMDKNSQSIAELLAQFFEYYAHFDFSHFAIDVGTGRRFLKYVFVSSLSQQDREEDSHHRLADTRHGPLYRAERRAMCTRLQASRHRQGLSVGRSG